MFTNVRLFRNNGDGTFTDIAGTAGVGVPINSFACWFWDYDNDGTPDAEGAGLRDPSHVYATPGQYSVRLVVTNDSAETAAFTNVNLVTVTLADIYVSTTGSGQAPYAWQSWAQPPIFGRHP